MFDTNKVIILIREQFRYLFEKAMEKLGRRPDKLPKN